MITPTTRSIASATLRAAFPQATAAAIEKALDEIAFAAALESCTRVQDLKAEIGGQTNEPEATASPPATGGLPLVPEGGEVVEVVRFFDKTWPDSCRVRTLLLRRADGSEFKAKFPAYREANWKAAASALGVDVDADWQAVQGQQAVVVIVTWNPPNGGEAMPVVRRWIARPGSQRATEKADAAAAKGERAAKRAAPKRDPRSPGVKVVDAMPADDDDIPF